VLLYSLDIMLKIIPLGGMGNVTRNMFAYETQGKVLLVDCGIGFPDESMPGVDLLIPDISYLENKIENIVGMILTHGHDDHIAGLPYILPRLGDHFPIYGSPLTAAFAESRIREFQINKRISILDYNQPLKLGPFTVHSIRLTHSIPDTRHLVISTPEGNVYHGSDFKIDLTPVDGIKPDLQKIAEFGQKGISVLLSDSLRSEKEGFSLSEQTLTDSFEREIRTAKGKFIMTTMSSNVHRIQQAVTVAVAHGRKIAFIGRSIEKNIKDASKLHMFNLPRQGIIDKRDIAKFPDNQLCLIIAGSQGQTGSSLVRIAAEEHDFVKLKAGDKVVFSSDPIPGNETAVYSTIDTLSQLGIDVVYPDINDNLHVSGHASSGELMLLMELVKPKYLMPIGGTYRHMVQYRKLAVKLGHPEKNVFVLDNGQTLILENPQTAKIGETLQLKNIMVDGYGVGDVGPVVLRDRQSMAKDGIVVAILQLEHESGKFAGKVELVSRGFVFMKQSQDLFGEAQRLVEEYLLKHSGKTDFRNIRDEVADKLQDFFYHRTNRNPMILPVIIEI